MPQKQNPETDPAKMNDEEKLQHKIRVDELANKMQLLISFAAELIPDIDILERVANTSSSNRNMAVTMAPILGAVGLDYVEKEMEWKVREHRSAALLNFVKVLHETEEERKAFKTKSGERDKARSFINKIIGGV